jgi:hypothetical protein
MIAGVRQDRLPEIRNRERSTEREVASRVCSIPSSVLRCPLVLTSSEYLSSPLPALIGLAQPTYISPSLDCGPGGMLGVTTRRRSSISRAAGIVVQNAQVGGVGCESTLPRQGMHQAPPSSWRKLNSHAPSIHQLKKQTSYEGGHNRRSPERASVCRRLAGRLRRTAIGRPDYLLE